MQEIIYEPLEIDILTFDIVYHKGTESTNADSLSHIPVFNTHAVLLL